MMCVCGGGGARVHACAHVCVRACVRVCVWGGGARVHACAHVCACVCVCVCVCVHVCMCIYVCTCVCLHLYQVLPVGTAITPPGMFKRKMNAEVRRKREGVHAWELPAIERTKYSFEHLAPACQSWRIPDSVPESSTGIVVSAMESGPGPAK